MNAPNKKNDLAILYVDDEEMALKYFAQTFSKDFTIITSNSVESAKKILDNQKVKVAVLLADQRMPNEKGVKLLAYAREQYPQIMRLLTTAYTDIEDAIEAVNTGEIYRYITKPWNVSELKEQLNEAIYLHLEKKHQQDLLSEKRSAMFQLAGNIAHELRTPLLAIKASATGAINFFPRLIDIYRKARKKDPSIPEIRNPNLKKMETIFDDFIRESHHSLTVIDMLMVNAANEHSNPDSFSTYSIRDCIAKALERYPFKNEQEKIVSFSNEIDFLTYGSPVLMTNVFFNLLKNALYAISANSDEGTIDIRLETGEDCNAIYFMDTSTGIDPLILPYIFEDFYSTKSMGLGHSIGLGLPFCRHTLQTFGGSIECQSELGVKTEFVLKLPIVPEPHFTEEPA